VFGFLLAIAWGLFLGSGVPVHVLGEELARRLHRPLLTLLGVYVVARTWLLIPQEESRTLSYGAIAGYCVGLVGQLYTWVPA
jgi:hypothetical protein